MTLDTTMVLAAGKGTRMRPLTDNCPKPLVQVGGRPLIEYALDLVRAAGMSRTVINTHYLSRQVTDYFAGYTDNEIIVSHEDQDLLETGGGVVNALPLIDRPAFFTLNSDSCWSNKRALSVLRDNWSPDVMDALLLLVPIENTKSYTRTGDFNLSKDGKISRPAYKGDRVPFVYTGAQIIKSSAFAGISVEPFSLNTIWTNLLASGRCCGCIYDGLWGDVGTPAGIIEAETSLLPVYMSTQV